jgi:hypothetical protein
MILQDKIAYTHADKFVLGKDAIFKLSFAPQYTVDTSYARFTPDGVLIVKRGFLWSANFPAMNTENTRPASLVHDALYELIKDGHLPRKPFKNLADMVMRDVLLECGILDARAWAWYMAVQIGGDNALNAPRPALMYSPVDTRKKAGWQARELLTGKP